MQNKSTNSTSTVAGTPPGRSISSSTKQEEGLAELINLLHAIWQRRMVVSMVTGICLVVAAIYCFRATPMYRAMATIEVAPQEKNVISIQDVNKLELNQIDVLNTLVLKSTRETVLKRVVEVNRLTNNPAFYVNGEKPSEMEVVAQIAHAVNSSLRRNTRLIDITAVSPDPQIAQLLANSVADQFIHQEAEDQLADVRFANTSLMEEADRFKGELERSERALQTYREEHKTVSLEDRQNIVDQKLHSLAEQLNDAKAEQTRLEAEKQQAGTLTNASDLLALPEIKKDPVVADLQAQVAQQETLVNLYSTRYKEKYPKMIEARQQLDELKRSVGLAALAARQTLDSVVAAARSQETGLQHALDEAQADALTLSKLSIDYNILQRQVDSNRILYQAILQRLKETEVSKGIERSAMQVVEAANIPARPFRPYRPLLLLAGLFGGLVLGVGLVLLLAQLDQTLKTPEDAEARLGVPAIGHLVFDREIEKAGKTLVMNRQNCLLAEGFRSLRASVALTARAEARQVVLFTSSVANEGKTVSASNYALALAQQNVKTAIVDLDLRRPRVSKTFGLKGERAGVADYLLGQASLETVVHPSEIANLDVVPAGRTVPNPAEQLAGPWLNRLLRELRGRYEVVVLDTAPVNPVSDTLTFITQADAVLLVVCGRYTAAKTVRRAVLSLQRAGIRPVGVVLNRMAAGQSYYNYDYVYGDKPGITSATPA